ncbi:hypothetical protein CC86DRAFT_279597 [Ophiobolus disseminans]|uniref:Uncharacterized protein n=1 Tax=Ophiobolus disseminans TaxID=1469910 RepID=A0A6A7AIW5_9PLEO|nr:hypothetical protein CC86DRAFT_279597 [Ophiobolus disseminans]
MRTGSADNIKDPRISLGKRLRKSEPLPLRSHSSDQEDLFYHEAQTSSLCWGPDESFWSELFLVDVYFGSEENYITYLLPGQGADPGDGLDPPLGGRGSMRKPLFEDPREYFLLKIDRRIEQVAAEYSALVETYNNRMEEYAATIRTVFEDDRQRTHTQTLSNVIETIHIFVDCLSGIVDAWADFSRTEIALFTRHAPDKPKWPGILARIARNISELERLRNLLIAKRERFRFKLESYVAFPLLFTTAFFSMDFATPPYPWAVFFGVLFGVSLLNYMIASQSSPRKTYVDLRKLMTKAWSDLVQWLKTLQ